jgi:L,D-transpeptidase ErfK/SrfK
MKKRMLVILLGLLLGCYSKIVNAEPYRHTLCNQEGISCMQVQDEDTWYSLWPDDRERDVVMRLNRMNVRLRPGMVIAVPDNLNNVDLMDISPFSYQIDPPGRRLVIVDPKRLAWGAYDAGGRLLNWGPASGGQGYCADVGHRCHTPAGSYSVYSKRGYECRSTKFPVGRGGAPMPYCMFFNGGYALHGSSYVPGYNASHGCIRMFTDDARWLNEDFVGSPKSTRVVVYHY